MSFNPSPMLLGSLQEADFNAISDQEILISASSYIIRNIVVASPSVSLTSAVGGIYTGAGKVGAIVPNNQAYSVLVSNTNWMDLALTGAAITDVLSETSLFLSLTTAQGSTAFADVYIYGNVLG